MPEKRSGVAGAMAILLPASRRRGRLRSVTVAAAAPLSTPPARPPDVGRVGRSCRAELCRHFAILFLSRCTPDVSLHEPRLPLPGDGPRRIYF